MACIAEIKRVRCGRFDQKASIKALTRAGCYKQAVSKTEKHHQFLTNCKRAYNNFIKLLASSGTKDFKHAK